MDKIRKISYTGKINIGNKELSCAVLDDGTRILTNTAVFQAFDRPRKGKPSEEYRLKNVPTFIAANNLKPYICLQIEAYKLIFSLVCSYLRNLKMKILQYNMKETAE